MGLKQGLLRGLSAGALMLGLVVTPQAQAQEAAPPLLIVPGLTQKDVPNRPVMRKVVRPPVTQPVTQPVVQPTAPIDRAPSGITVEGLADVSPEAVGILNRDPANPWTRDLGAGLWYGANPADAVRHIAALPEASGSPAARALSRQILLTAAAPPQGQHANAQAGDLIAARMDKLVASGLADEALSLADVLVQTAITETVARAQVQAMWLKGDVRGACAAADAGAMEYSGPFWQKMQTACAAIAGNTDKAQLTLALLDELQAIDAGFEPIANRILGKELSLGEIPAEMGVAEVAAFVAMGGKLPEDLPLRDKPWLVRFAIPAKGPISDGHLAALEFGLRRGILTLADAEAVFARVDLSDDEKKAVAELTAPGDTPRQRAAYYLALQAAAPKPVEPVAPAPDAEPNANGASETAETTEQPKAPVVLPVSAVQVEIAAKLLKAARLSPQDRAVLAVLLQEPLAAMAHAPLAAWLADDAMRLALWSGDWATATQWLELAKQNSGASEDARRAVRTLSPLMALVNAPQTAQMRAAMTLPPMLQTWGVAQGKRGVPTDQVAQIADRLFGLYRKFGMTVPAQDWAQVVKAEVKPYPVLTVSPVAAAAAHDAAVMGARGLALSGVAQQMGSLVSAGGASASPIAMETLVDVLLQAGAVDWGKRFAVESLLAAGA